MFVIFTGLVGVTVPPPLSDTVIVPSVAEPPSLFDDAVAVNVPALGKVALPKPVPFATATLIDTGPGAIPFVLVKVTVMVASTVEVAANETVPPFEIDVDPIIEALNTAHAFVVPPNIINSSASANMPLIKVLLIKSTFRKSMENNRF